MVADSDEGLGVLSDTELLGGGRGGADQVAKNIESSADQLAFLRAQLGL